MSRRQRGKEESQIRCLSGCGCDSSWSKVLNNRLKKWLCDSVCVNMPDDACPDTYHVERHDNHKVDADTSARYGKLPVLLHKLPVEGSKLFHYNETENHHSKHSCQNEGNLKREMVEREAKR